MEIHFFNTPNLLKSRTRLKEFIHILFKRNKVLRPGLNIIFCSDKELLKINQEYLSHDYFTDIITFDYPTDPSTFSEIYISIDRVKENTLAIGTSISKELHRVIFHGILHIIGYTDKSTHAKLEMTAAENRLLLEYHKFHVKQFRRET